MRRVIVNSTPLIALCNADLLNILRSSMLVIVSTVIQSRFFLICKQAESFFAVTSSNTALGIMIEPYIFFKMLSKSACR